MILTTAPITTDIDPDLCVSYGSARSGYCNGDGTVYFLHMDRSFSVIGEIRDPDLPEGYEAGPSDSFVNLRTGSFALHLPY